MKVGFGAFMKEVAITVICVRMKERDGMLPRFLIPIMNMLDLAEDAMRQNVTEYSFKTAFRTNQIVLKYVTMKTPPQLFVLWIHVLVTIQMRISIAIRDGVVGIWTILTCLCGRLKNLRIGSGELSV
eukprot:TRINITY_DN82505_c0_g1_i2.p4 TRINITY_DN82505_c0_g1~~TRINITY_DN82505_c0_g1_i2.p4  ORF type:complete len:127 (-),score=11.87 TRINITY_DN82505_c0_g1_i2:99-479(-)